MTTIIIIVVLAVLGVGGFYVGSRAADKAKLSSKERAELKLLRSLVMSITTRSQEFAQLGDPNAKQLLDEIYDTTKKVHEL